MNAVATIEQPARGIDFSRPLNLQLRIRNNILLQAIRQRAPSVTAFCRATGFNVMTAFKYIGFKRSPVTSGFRGRATEWRESAIRLCSLLDLAPEDAFPEEIVSRVERNTLEIFCAATEPERPQINPRDEVAWGDISEKIWAVLETLNNDERDVIDYRFGITDGRARTLEEVAKLFNRSRERIRQIESKALRKLRHPNRLAILAEADRDIKELKDGQ